MKYKKIKENILKLINIKTQTKEIIDQIYHESGDICLKIYTEDPITIFVENPYGMELLAKIFKKRIITSDEKIKGDYPIKKFFIYKDAEFFCLYKQEKLKRLKREKIIKFWSTIASFIKNIITILIGVFKILGKS